MPLAVTTPASERDNCLYNDPFGAIAPPSERTKAENRSSVPVVVSEAAKVFSVRFASDPADPSDPPSERRNVLSADATPEGVSVPASDLSTFRTTDPSLVKLADNALPAVFTIDPTGESAPASERLEDLETDPVGVAVPATRLIGSRANAPIVPTAPLATLLD